MCVYLVDVCTVSDIIGRSFLTHFVIVVDMSQYFYVDLESLKSSILPPLHILRLTMCVSLYVYLQHEPL